MSEPGPATAFCASHQAPATWTCARCGRFCCAACRQESKAEGHCSACAALLEASRVLGRERWRVQLAQLCMATPVIAFALFVAIALRIGGAWGDALGKVLFVVLGVVPFVASMSLAGGALHGAAPDFAGYLYRRILVGVVISTFFFLLSGAAYFS